MRGLFAALTLLLCPMIAGADTLPPATPSASPTPLSPLQLQGKGEVKTGSPTPTITGRGSPLQTLDVVIDGKKAGQVVVDLFGFFEFVLTKPLSRGSHEVFVRYADSSLGGASSNTITLVFTGVTPLDFDGDGITDLVSYRRVRGRVAYEIVTSGGSAATRRSLKGIVPVPGDYDGDGLCDTASLSEIEGNVVWFVLSSFSGSLSSVSFGQTDDVLLSGCRLTDRGRVSLAYFRKNQLSYLDYVTGTEQTIRWKNPGKRDLLGCADIDGDGIDELLFNTPGRDSRSSRIIVFSAKGERLYSARTGRFSTGLLIRRRGGTRPVLAIIRPSSESDRSVQMFALGASFRFPVIMLPNETIVSSGFFEQGAGGTEAALTWQEGRLVYMRLLAAKTKPVQIGVLEEGFRLAKPSVVVRGLHP